jgi:diguanylate cyclase (GGDEF)-like protein/PAS domain S-box-containing protein
VANEDHEDHATEPARSALPNEAFARLHRHNQPVLWLVLLIGLASTVALWSTLDRVRDDKAQLEDRRTERAFVVASESAARDGALELERVEEALVGLRTELGNDGSDGAGELSRIMGAFVPSESAAFVTQLQYVSVDDATEVVISAPAGTDLGWRPSELSPEEVTDAVTSGRAIVSSAPGEERVATHVHLPVFRNSDDGVVVAGWLSAMVDHEVASAFLLDSTSLRVALIHDPTVIERLANVDEDGRTDRLTRTDEGIFREVPIVAMQSGWILQAESAVESSETGVGMAELGAVLALLATGLVGVVLSRRLNAGDKALDLAETTAADLMASNARFRAGFEHSPIGMAELDMTGAVLSANPALADQLGMDRDELPGTNFVQLVHPDERDEAVGRIGLLLDNHTPATQVQHRYLRQNGEEIWVAEAMSAVLDREGRVASVLVQAEDISMRRRAERELQHQAHHDELTGLPNRSLFLDRLRRAMAWARRDERAIAVLFLDVDRFKNVNDSLGHHEGDVLLRVVAERIASTIREPDTVARFGGDEFVVLCEDLESEDHAFEIVDRIQRAISRPMRLGDEMVTITASVGVKVTDGTTDNADEVLRDADAAMYEAKRSGRDETHVADQATHGQSVERFELEQDLRRALDGDELRTFYQPVIAADGLQWSGAEALVRWQHPTKGLLSPASFLGVAEDLGLIEEIDVWMLRSALEQLRSWRESFPAAAHWHVALNGTAGALSGPGYIETVAAELKRSGIEPHQLVVEVTEQSLLSDTATAIRAIDALRAMGVSVAIDDFGTGYSSLSYLTRFNVDILKIDQEFIRQLPDSAPTAVIRAIIDLAHELGMRVIAEGVEQAEHADSLATMGVDFLQGYHFAKPLEPREFEDGFIAARAAQVAKTAF